MIPLSTYKIMHFIGLSMVLISLSALIAQTAVFTRRTLAVTHGLGLLLVLVSGFAMLAKLQIYWPLPAWVGAKLIIWLVLGAYMGFAPRWSSRRPFTLWWGLVALVALAAYFGLEKP